MVYSSNLGFPRIGPNREIKKAVEAYWSGSITEADLVVAANKQKELNWSLQKNIDFVPCNDFSLYDHVLDTVVALGAIPARYSALQKVLSPLDLYFAMARGRQCSEGVDVKAMEMTKWFDTNYHYITPEFEEGLEFKLNPAKILDEVKQAKAAGVTPRPVVLGPVSFLLLGKAQHKDFDFKATLGRLVPLYVELLTLLVKEGVTWVQLDEPCLVLDLTQDQKDLFTSAYATIDEAKIDIKVLVASYFESLADNAALAYGLPVDAIHIDLCRTSGRSNTDTNSVTQDVDQAIKFLGQSNKLISLGVVDARNIWVNDIRSSIKVVESVVKAVGADRVIVSPSASLLHSPVDLNSEVALDAHIKSWLSFAVQKLGEITTIVKGVKEGVDAISTELARSDAVVQDRLTNTLIHNEEVKGRVAKIATTDYTRASPYTVRRDQQVALPLFPTTTIGSFPQTSTIRSTRSQFKTGKITEDEYVTKMQEEIKKVVDFQTEVGLDVLVHGEPERNDMVEYFGELLSGFAFTKFGWVQSYGSRCVKPAIIYGDVSRANPMTVKWSAYAQSITDKPMKAMLTGAVTVLQWSFCRDDQPRSTTAKQLALAIRDEVNDLQSNGLKVIQVDEAALREGMPLRASDRDQYLTWAVDCFKLIAGVARDDVQIHTHMCYSEFNEIIEWIAAMDADAISIETSRSNAELLNALSKYNYPNEIGPGVYDIHSPRVPSVEEMVQMIEASIQVIPVKRVWVNPDCGLKTRQWKEVEPALKNMVEAAKIVRAKHQA